MAKSEQFRFFTIDEKKYHFDPTKFKRAVNDLYLKKKQAGKTITKARITEEIGEKVSKSPEAVKKWAQGHNGPDDLETIQLIADYLGIDRLDLLSEEWSPLMKPVNGYMLVPIDQEVTRLDIEEMPIVKHPISADASEKEIIIRYYHILVDFIYEYLSYYIALRNQPLDVGDYPFGEKYGGQITSIFRFLHTIRLQVNNTTYDKMHRIASEITAYWDERIWIPSRWIKENPLLSDAIHHLENSLSFDEAMDEGEYGHKCFDEYQKKLQKETGYDSQQVSDILTIIPSFDVASNELSNTLYMLFKKDFATILKET